MLPVLLLLTVAAPGTVLRLDVQAAVLVAFVGMALRVEMLVACAVQSGTVVVQVAGTLEVETLVALAVQSGIVVEMVAVAL
jgi:hypothetical protein